MKNRLFVFRIEGQSQKILGQDISLPRLKPMLPEDKPVVACIGWSPTVGTALLNNLRIN
jgi:hypothetical protein